MDSTSIKPEEVAYYGTFRLYNAESSHAKGYRVEFQLGSEDDYRTFKALTKRRKGKAGILFRCYLMDRNSTIAEFEGEFAGWGVSNQLGAKVRFNLSSETAFNAFRELPALASSDKPAEWNVVLVEIADTGEVVNQAKRETVETLRGGPVSQHAGKLCADKLFQQYVRSAAGLDKIATPDECAEFIREKCRIESRRELDHDTAARERYHRWITKPFAIWSEGR